MSTIKTKKRPLLLTWLCIGSLIFGISWIIMFVILLIFSFRGPIPTGLFPGKVIEYMAAGYGFLLAEILLTSIGLVAVSLMWSMKRTGFFLYAGIKTLLYFLPILFLGTDHLTFLPLAVTSTLIIGYGVSVRGFESG